MSASVLDQITLGYRQHWNRLRQAGALELFVDTGPAVHGVDARHLLAALAELWPARAPQLLLTIRNPALLNDMLVHGGADGPWVTVPESALADALLRQRVLQARQRGLRLVWQGAPGQSPSPELASAFACIMLHAAQSAELMQLPTGQILLSPATRAQAAYALDQRGAWSVAGWPAGDTVAALRAAAAQPARLSIQRVLRAIEQDASLDRIEALVLADPVLAYRTLCQLNARELGLRSEVYTLQQGLMLAGLGKAQRWLQDWLAQAVDETDLHPVRTQIVTRARVLEHVLDAGDEDELRRDIYLCGLYSGLHVLLGEPLPEVLKRLPVSERTQEALLAHSGPYVGALQLTLGLERADAQRLQSLCAEQDMALEDLNRALLRALIAPPA